MACAWAATTCALAAEPSAGPYGDGSTPAATIADAAGPAATATADTAAAHETAAADSATTAPVLDSAMPRPKALERDVQFWVRVYTQVDTNAGFLHDQYNLSVVYETLHFSPNTSSRERERTVDQARNRYVATLRRITAAKDGPLSDDDQRIKNI